MNDLMALLIIVLVLGLSLSMYFLPTIVAAVRSAEDEVGVFILNFFLGWTLCFWVLALVWAFTSKSYLEKQQ